MTDSTLAKYVARILELRSQFETFQLTKIPKFENEQMDYLLKLASDSLTRMRSVYVEVLNKPSLQKSRSMKINANPGDK